MVHEHAEGVGRRATDARRRALGEVVAAAHQHAGRSVKLRMFTPFTCDLKGMQPCTPRSSRSMSPHSTVSRMFVPARPTCDDLVFLNRS